MYSFGQDDSGTSSDEGTSSANSPSTEEDEDLVMNRSEGDPNGEDIGSEEPPI